MNYNSKSFRVRTKIAIISRYLNFHFDYYLFRLSEWTLLTYM